ncbi:histidine kinase [Lampropedia puyangensis]|uniref:histidine kinase n=1 Tax=Lampropedia puyangensis TaxID=1330072 RepID=A0A4S8F6G1_9BURK|nr:histidine kinase dimerization/phospho-acceptor domain-containing protein [Lampropedia puyangensis]THU02491.1 histidine kinase [Lampropedia puyangensis]
MSQVQAIIKQAPLLRNRMLRNVLLPLIVTWLCATAVMVGVAKDFTGRVFDRTLLDHAHALAARLQQQDDGTLKLDLDEHEIGNVLYEPVETVMYAILNANGQSVIGAHLEEAFLPSYFQEYRYGFIRYAQKPMRTIALRHSIGDGKYFVVVAHTTQARNHLVQRLMWFGSLPILLMLFPLAIWLWDRIERDLQPLAQLHDALLVRDAKDLSPLTVATTSREVEQVGKALNDLIDRLDRNIATQREFAGNVAHELRTPLAGIKAMAEFGLVGQDPAVQREQLSQIVSSTERAARLVNQLLDLAMLDEDQVALHIVDVDLADLVRQTVLRHLDKADSQGVDLGAQGLDESEAQGCWVQADSALLTGLLDNLIDNALRYGGHTVTVAVNVNPRTRMCSVSVEDDGPGIPASVRTAMMQRSTQGSDGELLGQGAGLGLFLVARYARLLGSHLQLDSGEGGRGLKASVWLPLVRRQ